MKNSGIPILRRGDRRSIMLVGYHFFQPLRKKLVTFLRQIPDTVYVAVFTAISTLLGVFLTNNSSARRTALELKHARNERLRDLFFSKLEDLYILFSQWDDSLTEIHNNRVALISGNPRYRDGVGKPLDGIILDEGSDVKIARNRIEMLIHLYFPQLFGDYVKVLEKWRKCDKLFFTYQNKEFFDVINEDKLLEKFLDAYMEFSNEKTSFNLLIGKQAELMAEPRSL